MGILDSLRSEINEDRDLIFFDEVVSCTDVDEFEQFDTPENGNSYAHPTGRNPTKKEVICALNTTVKLFLSKPHLFRHVM